MDYKEGLNMMIRRLWAAASLLVCALTFAGDGTYLQFGDTTLPIERVDGVVAVLPAPGERLQSQPGVAAASAETLTSGYAILSIGSAGVQAAEAQAEAMAETAAAIGGSSVGPVYAKANGDKLLMNGKITIHFPADWSDAQIAALAARYQLTAGTVSQISDAVITYASPDAFSVVELAASIAEQEAVEYVYPSYIDTGRKLNNTFVVNDPLYEQQWYLRNTGSEGLAGADINIGSVWNSHVASVHEVVAVVDDYVEWRHEDLNHNVYEQYWHDFTGQTIDTVDSPRFAISNNNHGTAVAGVIGAVGGNGIGIIGVAPRAAMINHQIFFDGSSNITAEEEAVALSARSSFVDIYNNSWGLDGALMLPLTSLAVRNAIRDGRKGLGTIYVFAAGNDSLSNSNYSGLTNSRYTITVGASTNRGRAASYTTPGAPTLINAPSGGGTRDILTTDFMDEAGNAAGNYDTSFSGTSAAAPMVSGVIALMLDAQPNLTWQDIQHILLVTAQRNDPTNSSWEPGIKFETVLNDELRAHTFWFSPLYGFGRVDAQAAVNMAKSFNTTGPRTARELTAQSTTFSQINGVTEYTFEFDSFDNLFVEHVRVTMDTAVGGNSVTLTSPAGTTSLLDPSGSYANLSDSHWDLTSVRHYGEPSKGVWTLSIDGAATTTDVVIHLSLFGRPDMDNNGFGDGLPDDWERTFFGRLANLDAITPNNDDNNDGKTNWQHFLDGTNPSYPRGSAVYHVRQNTRQAGHGSAVTRPRYAYLVDDTAARTLRGIFYYTNRYGIRSFHVEEWGTVTETGEDVIHNYLAQADRTLAQVVASADYVDSPQLTLDEIADNWSVRFMLGTRFFSGRLVDADRGDIALRLNGLFMSSQPDSSLTQLGSITGTIHPGYSRFVNHASNTTDDLIHELRLVLLRYGFVENKLNLQVTLDAFYENDGANASIGTVSRTSSVLEPLTVTLTSSDKTEVVVEPTQIVIPGGASATTFALDAVDDEILDGTQVGIEIRASAPDHTSASVFVDVFDNE